MNLEVYTFINTDSRIILTSKHHANCLLFLFLFRLSRKDKFVSAAEMPKFYELICGGRNMQRFVIVIVSMGQYRICTSIYVPVDLQSNNKLVMKLKKNRTTIRISMQWSIAQPCRKVIESIWSCRKQKNFFFLKYSFLY